jgi:hypothetical protein
MEKQLHGTEAALSQGNKKNMEHDGRTGKPSEQLLGSQAPLNHTPISFEHNHSGGEMQLLGEQAPCNYNKAHHGYQSGTEMSERSIKQSKP